MGEAGMKRATTQETAYPRGFFSQPVKAWPGLCDYEPRLHAELIKPAGSFQASVNARDIREKALTGDDADKKFAALGTVRGMALKLFTDRPGANAVGVNRGNKPEPDTYHGTPCKLGHTLRYAKNSNDCVTCKRDRLRAKAAKEKASDA
jgi:hypothetical protein